MDQAARIAYDSMAPVYDDFTAQNDYELWFSILLPKLEELGLRRGRLLDVACGTGRAFEAMLRRGWEISACDISPEMVARAREKFADREIDFDVRDMRELPRYGEDGFQLVWALNDPVNYLTGDGDLELGLAAMGQNLADDGLLVFDCNTQAVFGGVFEPGGSMDRGERWSWTGQGQVDGVYEAVMSGDGVETHVHRERWYPVAEVQAALAEVGLTPLAALGQSESGTEIVIGDDWDEERDVKIIHVARRA